MSKFACFSLFLTMISASTTVEIPNFYSIALDQPIKAVQGGLSDNQLKEIDSLLASLSQDQRQASIVAEGLLKQHGFRFERLNKQAPYNYRIMSIPNGNIMSSYLNKLLSLKGEILLVFDEPLQSLISRAHEGGIRLDPIRFFLSIKDPLSIIPHEVTHFVHIQDVKRGIIQAYNSGISANEPYLAIYKNGFWLDEIEAHLGDAYLIKHRGPIQGESFIDHQGKAALVFMMLKQVNIALDSIEKLMNDSRQNYLETGIVMGEDKNQFGTSVRFISLNYLDKKKNELSLHTFSTSSLTSIDKSQVYTILHEHRKYINSRLRNVADDFSVETLEQAKKILKEQAPSLIH